MDAVQQFLDVLNGYLWGWPMLVLLLGTHPILFGTYFAQF